MSYFSPSLSLSGACHDNVLGFVPEYEKAQGDVGQGYNKELPSHPFGATRVDRLQYMGQIFGY